MADLSPSTVLVTGAGGRTGFDFFLGFGYFLLVFEVVFCSLICLVYDFVELF